MQFDFEWPQVIENLLRVLAALALALPLGWEREHGRSSVGLRTLPVVAMAACGFALVGRWTPGADAESQAALAQTLSVVWLTPAMDRLFQDGAGERRRFLDRLVLSSDPAHANRLARYAHVLRQRTKLLRAGRFDPSWLGGLERQAAATGVAIAAARRATARALAAARIEVHARPPRTLAHLDDAVFGDRLAVAVDGVGRELARGL